MFSLWFISRVDKAREILLSDFIIKRASIKKASKREEPNNKLEENNLHLSAPQNREGRKKSLFLGKTRLIEIQHPISEPLAASVSVKILCRCADSASQASLAIPTAS